MAVKIKKTKKVKGATASGLEKSQKGFDEAREKRADPKGSIVALLGWWDHTGFRAAVHRMVHTIRERFTIQGAYSQGIPLYAKQRFDRIHLENKGNRLFSRGYPTRLSIRWLRVRVPSSSLLGSVLKVESSRYEARTRRSVRWKSDTRSARTNGRSWIR